MKILATNDIHQMGNKWKLLVNHVKEHKPDIVLIAGDIFPKDRGIQIQMDFLESMREYAQSIKDTGAQLIFTLGNDDNQLAIPSMILGDTHQNLWRYVSEKVVKINGYEFVGMPYVPDYPFGYKYWCRAEFKRDLRMDPFQYGDPVIIDANNEYEVIPDYKKYLTERQCIWDCLVSLMAKVENMSKSIWLIHAPPANLGLDVCSSGNKVGSQAIYKFIKEHQPMLTIHGHIHESVIYSKIWKAQVDKTICVQGGQMDRKLYYSIINIDNDNINMEHSIYGK